MAYLSIADMQEKRNQMMADRQQSAHDRFVQRRTNFVESNPNAVSQWERQSYLGRQRQLQDEDRLRQFEIDKLKQQGTNDVAVEKAKVEGMIGQGSKAAEFNAEASKYTADAQKEAALKKAEVDAANGAAQWGKFDDAGNFTPGSEVEKAKLTTQATLENARLEREARISAAEKMATGRADVARINAGAKITAADTSGKATVEAARQRAEGADQRAFDTWLANLNDVTKSAGMSTEELQKIKGMSPEEQRAYWMKLTGRSN